MRAELFLADRRTDLTKLIVAFRSFSNAPKSDYQLSLILPYGVLFFLLKCMFVIQCALSGLKLV